MEEIKACPFCGAEADIENTTIGGGKRVYFVKCSNGKCGVRSAPAQIGLNELFECKRNVEVTTTMAIRHVVSLWNERSDKPPVYPWSKKRVKPRAVGRGLK